MGLRVLGRFVHYACKVFGGLWEFGLFLLVILGWFEGFGSPKAGISGGSFLLFHRFEVV